MEYKKFLKDFVERTKENYKTIDEHDNGFEVTQLINSAVALLIVPKEQKFKEIVNNKKVVNAIDKTLMKNIENLVKSTYKNEINKSITFKQLICHLRNGIAHGNIEPNSDDSEKITHITITDKNYKYIKRKKVATGEVFSVKLSIKLLKDFFWQFSDAVIHHCN